MVLFGVIVVQIIVQLASASELKLDGELHYNLLEVTLQNTADYEVRFFLKFDLKEKTSSEWKLISPLNCSVNSSIGPLASDSYNCSYTTPEKPGEYKIYARAAIANSTYTYKDFLFNVGESGAAEPAGTKKSEEVTLKILSAPEAAKTGEEFAVVVNVTSGKDTTLEVYSYIYSGKACYSFLGWKGNAQKYEFKEGETKTINLTDTASHEAANGTYSLKVRAREQRGDSFKDYDVVRQIEVEQVAIDLFKELPKTEDRRPAASSGGMPIQLLLPLAGSIPLVVLLIKKAL